jgi:hypothetical protein
MAGIAAGGNTLRLSVNQTNDAPAEYRGIFYPAPTQQPRPERRQIKRDIAGDS